MSAISEYPPARAHAASMFNAFLPYCPFEVSDDACVDWDIGNVFIITG